MSPIGPYHAGIVARLTRLFIHISRDRWIVWAQSPLRLDDYSEPQPDLLLLRPSSNGYTTRHPGPADVFLLLEVADSSLLSDRAEKIPLYAAAGLPEVWLVNLVEGSIEVFRQPSPSGFASQTVWKSPAVASPLAFPDVQLPLPDLFRR